MSVRVEHADMLEAIPLLVAKGVVCDAVVTDPPYHLMATLSRFGKQGSVPVQHGRDGAMARLSGGFMGQQWDGGDIAFRPETWATVATILRPGAFLVAFGGTRTYHRLVSAIEDAGFVIQDQIAWLFATGFPKRRDMLKPAFEPICLAYKPGGTRTMQVDECRIGVESTTTIRSGNSGAQGIYGRDDRVFNRDNPPGRWPANVLTDGSDEVVACFPESAGMSQVHHLLRGKTTGAGLGYGSTATIQDAGIVGFSDAGSAARFFFSAKAGAEDRWGSRHPTIKPIDLIAWLVKLITPPSGTFLDPFAGSGTAAIAALKTGRNAILIEREAGYIADIRERIAFYEGGGQHSTQAKNRNRKIDHGPLFGGDGT